MPQDYGPLDRVLRMGEGRRLKRLAEQAAYIGTLEPEFEALSDDQLAGKTVEFKQRLEKGESWRTCCSRPSPLSVRPSSASWASASSMFSSWAASCSTRATSPR